MLLWWRKPVQMKGLGSAHKRFHMHFTPTSASWLNQVERFFGLITEDRIRCGAFKSVTQLEATNQEYLENRKASPGRWHACLWRSCHLAAPNELAFAAD
jgi:hypothetical protein